MLLCLASSLATVGRQVGRQVDENLSFGDFLKFYFQPPVNVFLFLMLYLMLDGLILFHNHTV